MQDAGGSPRLESIQDKAARLKRTIDWDTTRKSFLTSEAGVAASRKEFAPEFADLLAIVEEKAMEIKTTSEFPMQAERAGAALEVCSAFGCIAIEWCPQYANTLDGSYLAFSLWDAKPYRPGRMFFNEPSRIREIRYELDQLRSDHIGWREAQGKEICSSEMLADRWLGMLMDYATNEKRKHPR